MHTSDLPVTIVIFGASGDLTHRKLIPALYNNFYKDRLPAKTNIIGFARRPWTQDFFTERLRAGVEQHSRFYKPEIWAQFAHQLHYFQGNLTQPSTFSGLNQYLGNLEDGAAHRLYYLATAPQFYSSTAQYLGELHMTRSKTGWRHIVVEKPFGHDLASAQKLNQQLHHVFDEDQIYRIDHYLGKETAQNIIFLRFANAIFEPVWNRKYIDNVQITVSESVDVGHRGGYYDTAGVLRDMFQNHLLQLLTLIAMEPPVSLDATAVRNAKANVLQGMPAIDLNNTVLAQYDGYRATAGIAADSRTPTYAALKLFVDNWRWKGVPFYLRSGKALPRKTSEITIEFQAPPDFMFNLRADASFTSNRLSICVQPDEGIHLTFEAKEPGSIRNTRSVNMMFQYQNAFDGAVLPDAYERLLLDALKGDASLFARSDEIEYAWSLMDPVLQGYAHNHDLPIHTYAKESWGPAAADALLARQEHRWRLGCAHR